MKSTIEIMQLTANEKEARLVQIQAEFDDAQCINEFFYRTKKAQDLRAEMEVILSLL